MKFVPVEPSEEPAAGMIAAMEAEMDALYGAGSMARTPTLSPEQMAPPSGGVYLAVVDDATVLGGGGLRRLEEDIAEIKRMYVVAEARNRGVARRLLEALEDHARHLGYTKVRLDTGPLQHHAKALYESAGYRSIASYNSNQRAAFWGEKDLV